MADPPTRPVPQLDDGNRRFWTSGRDGELVVQRCGTCRHLVHPPVLRCPHDRSADLRWEAVSGTGRVESWTENLHSWLPGFEAPYLVALVALDDDPTARVLTNLVDVDPASVVADLPVEVTFEHVAGPSPDDDVWVPLFRPRARSTT